MARSKNKNLSLDSYSSSDEYNSFNIAKEAGRLPSGRTISGGLSDGKILQLVRHDLGDCPNEERSSLDKLGQLNKVVSDSASLCSKSGYRDSEKYCQCHSCKQKRVDQEDNRATVYESDLLRKKAVAKTVSRKLAKALYSLPNSPLRKSYGRSMTCAQRQYVENGQIKTEYCKCRWCLVCNRIRMAENIKNYVPVLSAWENAYMLTLTIPNCSGFELDNKIQTMQDMFTAIKRKVKRGRKRKTYVKKNGSYVHDKNGNRIVDEAPFQGVRFQAIRKLEVTYNIKEDSYHPHYHILINSKRGAQLLKQFWLDSFRSASGLGQDLTTVDRDNLGAVKELFKYFTKVFSAVKDKNGESLYSAHVDKLDVIFQAIDGKRTLQTYGFKKSDYQEQIENYLIGESLEDELNESQIEELIEFNTDEFDNEYRPEDGMFIWDDNASNWIHEINGQPIVDFTPNAKLRTLLENIFIYGVAFDDWDIHPDDLRNLNLP